eukprot:729585-Pyramimonas_sp.AAC.1
MGVPFDIEPPRGDRVGCSYCCRRGGGGVEGYPLAGQRAGAECGDGTGAPRAVRYWGCGGSYGAHGGEHSASPGGSVSPRGGLRSGKVDHLLGQRGQGRPGLSGERVALVAPGGRPPGGTSGPSWSRRAPTWRPHVARARGGATSVGAGDSQCSRRFESEL